MPSFKHIRTEEHAPGLRYMVFSDGVRETRIPEVLFKRDPEAAAGTLARQPDRLTAEQSVNATRYDERPGVARLAGTGPARHVVARDSVGADHPVPGGFKHNYNVKPGPTWEEFLANQDRQASYDDAREAVGLDRQDNTAPLDGLDEDMRLRQAQKLRSRVEAYEPRYWPPTSDHAEFPMTRVNAADIPGYDPHVERARRDRGAIADGLHKLSVDEILNRMKKR